MYLPDYQSRQFLSRCGIPTVPGTTVTSPEAAAASAADFAAPVVVRAAIPGRPRIFRLANTPPDAEHSARDLLAMTIRGARIRTLVIEPAVEAVARYFLGIYADRGGGLVMIASTDGGDDASPVERGMSEHLVSETINPFLGALDFQGRNLASAINLPRDSWSAFVAITQNLFRCVVASDALRAEINPLALTPEGELLALGGELMIDDSALFRQPEVVATLSADAAHDRVALARAAGLTYVHLGGRIGCAVGGAGLGMATLDMLARHGCDSGCFLDLGSSVRRETLDAALRLILPDAEAALLNIFANHASGGEIAQDLLALIGETPLTAPLIVRLAGRDAEQGLEALEAAAIPHLIIASELTEAARLVSAAAKGYTDVNLSR